MSEIAEFDLLLNDVLKKDALVIWIPSKGTYYPFKHLTFEQHTRFLALESEQNLDEVEQTFKFAAILNQVIRECHLGTENIDEITVIDRNAIALQLRVALDDRFKVVLNENTVDISLKEHVSRVTTIGNARFERNITVSHGSLGVLLDIPSISTDQTINTEILSFDSESEEFPQFLLMAELVKFMKTVIITKDGQNTELSLFTPGKIIESIHVCKRLPLPLLNLVGEYIQKVQNIEAEIMTLVIPVPNVVADEPITQEVPILINTNWFTSV